MVHLLGATVGRGFPGKGGAILEALVLDGLELDGLVLAELVLVLAGLLLGAARGGRPLLAGGGR